MTHIILDGAKIQDREGLHDLLSERLNLPEWYGRNLDALYDCLTDLTEVTVFLRNAGAMTGALGDYGDKVLRVFRDAAAENPGFGFAVI